MTTDASTWLIGQLRDRVREQSLILPRFQRAVVWGEDRERELIDSINNGFPFGAILLYESGELTSDDRPQYVLIDGLQRTSSIVNYMAAPLKYLNVKDLSSRHLIALVEVLNSQGDPVNPDLVEQAVEEWMRETENFRRPSGYTERQLVSTILRVLDMSVSDEIQDTMYPHAEEWLEEIQAEADIADIPLPVLIFRGDRGDLPEIFTRLNRAGIQLNKYQIFAAGWVDDDASVDNEEILRAIQKKYEDLEGRGFNIADLPSPGQPWNFFEYLFGLGRVLADDFPMLLGSSEDETETEPHAFLLATVCSQLRDRDMGNLPNAFIKDREDRIVVRAFEHAVFESTEFVRALLDPYIGIRLNRRGDRETIDHSENQILSMIARALVSRYVSGRWVERPGWEEEWDAFRKTYPQFYLYDVLMKNWRGAGDNRRFDWTWATDAEGNVTGPSPSYLAAPVSNRADWEQMFEVYFKNDQLPRLLKDRGNVRGIDRVFLRFVYSNRLTYMQERQNRFDIEHLYPVKVLKDVIPESSEGWPISCVGNLALLEQGMNRSKGNETIMEHIENMNLTPEAQERLTRSYDTFTIVRPEDIDLHRDNQGRPHVSEADYRSFIEARFNMMTAEILDSLNVPR